MGDEERRPPLRQPLQSLHDQCFGLGVERRGRLVQDHDGGVFEDRPGDRQSLALTARQRRAALADHRVVALWQTADELVGVGHLGRLSDPPRRGPRSPVGDVLRHRQRQDEGILQHDGYLLAQARQCHRPHVDPVDRYQPSPSVVEAGYQRHQRRLPRPGASYQCDRLPGTSLEGHPPQHRPIRLVAEAHPPEPHVTRRPLPERHRPRPIDHVPLGLQHLQHPLQAGGGFFQLTVGL